MFRPARQFLALSVLFMAVVTLVLPQQARAQNAGPAFEKVVRAG